MISALLITGCLGTQNPSVELKAGQTPQEVEAALGQPDEVNDFVMPDGPFFGPQEALSGLVSAGSVVEERQYKVNDDVIYVWFYGDSTAEKNSWRLIATATVSKDAVY